MLQLSPYRQCLYFFRASIQEWSKGDVRNTMYRFVSTSCMYNLKSQTPDLTPKANKVFCSHASVTNYNLTILVGTIKLRGDPLRPRYTIFLKRSTYFTIHNLVGLPGYRKTLCLSSYAGCRFVITVHPCRTVQNSCQLFGTLCDPCLAILDSGSMSEQKIRTTSLPLHSDDEAREMRGSQQLDPPVDTFSMSILFI
jgi:hypothetical protein